MDDFLPALVTGATRDPAVTTQTTVDEVMAMINTNRAGTEGYLNVRTCKTVVINATCQEVFGDHQVWQNGS
jgi:hypothetical protein